MNPMYLLIIIKSSSARAMTTSLRGDVFLYVFSMSDLVGVLLQYLESTRDRLNLLSTTKDILTNNTMLAKTIFLGALIEKFYRYDVFNKKKERLFRAVDDFMTFRMGYYVMEMTYAREEEEEEEEKMDMIKAHTKYNMMDIEDIKKILSQIHDAYHLYGPKYKSEWRLYMMMRLRIHIDDVLL